MRVIVTGGRGFLGREVVTELLRRGHEPFVVDDQSTCDLENVPEWLSRVEERGDFHYGSVVTAPRIRADAIVHLACRYTVEGDYATWLHAWRGYVADFLHMFQNQISYGLKRVIVGSTLEIYAPERQGTFGSIASSLRQAIRHWHRPPRICVEFVHMPELLGAMRIAPSALWTVPGTSPLEQPRAPTFTDVAMVEDVARVVVDRLEASPRRAMDWVVTGTRFEEWGLKLPIESDEMLFVEKESLKKMYSVINETRTKP